MTCFIRHISFMSFISGPLFQDEVVDDKNYNKIGSSLNNDDPMLTTIKTAWKDGQQTNSSDTKGTTINEVRIHTSNTGIRHYYVKVIAETKTANEYYLFLDADQQEPNSEF